MDYNRTHKHEIKDMPQDLPEKTRRSAQTTLDVLLRRVTKNIKKEDVLPPSQQQPDRTQQKLQRLPQTCLILATELSHMNRHVRDTESCFLVFFAKAVVVVFCVL